MCDIHGNNDVQDFVELGHLIYWQFLWYEYVPKNFKNACWTVEKNLADAVLEFYRIKYEVLRNTKNRYSYYHIFRVNLVYPRLWEAVTYAQTTTTTGQ